MAARITQDEWLKELQRIQASSPDGLTANEWQKRLGQCIQVVRERLRDGIRAGLIEYNGTRDSCRMDGVPCKVPVYRVVEKKKR